MAKKPKPKPYVHPSEMNDGTYPAGHKGQAFEKTIDTREGSDGVDETHITYRKRSTKKYYT